MVKEREPPKAPISPQKQDPIVTHQPEFGKPTSLHSPLRSSVFNIPKPHKQRPEHHRTQLSASSNRFQPQKNQEHSFVDLTSSQQPSPLFTSRSVLNDDDVVEISKPTNAPTWSSYPVKTPLYSSHGTVQGSFSSINPYNDSKRLGSFMNQVDNELYEDRFGALDPYAYVDTAQATENIKALLEGVFDEEEDKVKTRSKKKQLDSNATELANQLQGLTVNSKDGEGSESTHNESENEEQNDGTVDGMEVKLLPHQVDGVFWMKEKESGVKKKNGVLPKGGILADDMGLGKTIQSISLILTNPRTNSTVLDKSAKKTLSDQVEKGTLVVAPLALIRQWEAEIKDRVSNSHTLKVCVHHGPQRTKNFQDLRKYDVVITTYQILVSEYGSSSKEDNGPKVGCLGLHWYRVILDEAHTIKNRNAKATQACYALRAEYRWCLTGTPMQNNLDELQSLIKFLRIKPYDQLPVWREQISRPMSNGRGEIAIKRLQFYLKAFMKRRTKDVLKEEGGLNPGGKSTANGGPSRAFKITERRIEKIVAVFSPRERSFYYRLEERANKSLKQMMGASQMSYASALVLLLRLRQACNHPDLVRGNMANEKDALTTGQEMDKQSSRKPKVEDKELDEMADLLGGLSVKTKRCDVCQIELSNEESSSGVIRCADCEGDLVEQSKLMSKNKRKTVKSKQSSPPAQTQRSKAKSRNTRRIVVDSDDDEEIEGEGDWIVPEHQRQTQDMGKAGGSDDENAEGGGEWLDSDDTNTGDEASIQTLGSHKKKSRSSEISTKEFSSKSPKEGKDDESDDDSPDDSSSNESSISNSTSSSPDTNLPKSSPLISTKIRCLLEILNREAADYKFIVFSSFTTMLDLIEPFLRRAGLKFTRYDGSMRNDHREASLERLRNDKHTRILLCSLKCGSLGLNLTAASRVVILEPFWNPFVEEQAIDRVHRLNQTIDVVVYKITIRSSVEERILELQEKKRALAESAIEGKSVKKLSMQDILNLFRHDTTGLDGKSGTHGALGGRPRLLSPAKTTTNTTTTTLDNGDASSEQERRKDAGRGTRDKERKSGSREDSVWGRRWD